jgi:hypothetical protein
MQQQTMVNEGETERQLRNGRIVRKMPLRGTQAITVFKSMPCAVKVGEKMSLTLRNRANNAISVFHNCEVIEMQKTTCNGENGYKITIALPNAIDARN